MGSVAGRSGGWTTSTGIIRSTVAITLGRSSTAKKHSRSRAGQSFAGTKQARGLYLYYRALEKRWVIAEQIVPSGTVQSATRGPRIEGPWQTYSGWEGDEAMRVTEVRNVSGHGGVCSGSMRSTFAAGATAAQLALLQRACSLSDDIKDNAIHTQVVATCSY